MPDLVDARRDLGDGPKRLYRILYAKYTGQQIDRSVTVNLVALARRFGKSTDQTRRDLKALAKTERDEHPGLIVMAFTRDGYVSITLVNPKLVPEYDVLGQVVAKDPQTGFPFLDQHHEHGPHVLQIAEVRCTSAGTSATNGRSAGTSATSDERRQREPDRETPCAHARIIGTNERRTINPQSTNEQHSSNGTNGASAPMRIGDAANEVLRDRAKAVQEFDAATTPIVERKRVLLRLQHAAPNIDAWFAQYVAGQVLSGAIQEQDMPTSVRRCGSRAKRLERESRTPSATVLVTFVICYVSFPVGRNRKGSRSELSMWPSELKAENVVAVIDQREQHPLDLSPLRTVRATLTTGDYSVRGLEDVIAIERKSLSDLLVCIGVERKRFDRQVKRLLAYSVRALVVEAWWTTIEAGEWRSKVTTSAAVGSVLGWVAAGLPVVMAGDHKRAGRFVARLLYIAARRRWREAQGLLVNAHEAD